MNGHPQVDSPSNVITPVSGVSNWVSRLKNVVLPAPFGPINAVIAPSLHLDAVDVDGPKPSEGPTHAVGDQDRVGLGRTRPSARPRRTCRSPGCSNPAASSPRHRRPTYVRTRHPDQRPGRRAFAVGVVTCGHRSRSLSCRRRFLEVEDHQQHQRQADQHETDRADLRAGHQPVGHDVVVDQFDQHVLGERQDHPEQHGADQRAPHPGETTEDRRGQREEGLLGRVVVGLDRVLLHGVEDAGEGAERSTEDQRLHLEPEDVLAERRRGVLVLTDRPKDTTPRDC